MWQKMFHSVNCKYCFRYLRTDYIDFFHVKCLSIYIPKNLTDSSVLYCALILHMMIFISYIQSSGEHLFITLLIQ